MHHTANNPDKVNGKAVIGNIKMYPVRSKNNLGN
jgi:hypothetical protein